MDLSQYSDEELQAMLNEQSAAPIEPPAVDLSSYSTEELQAMLGQEQAPPPAQGRTIEERLRGLPLQGGAMGALAMGASDIGTFGTADEMIGRASGVGSEAAREVMGQYREQYPKSFLAGQVLGGIGQAAMIPVNTVKGIGYAGAAGLGALSGGLYGAGGGVGGAQERLGSAAQGAALGAAGGAAGLAVGRTVQSLAQRARGLFAKTPAQKITPTMTAQEIQPVENIGKVSKSQKDVFSMTKGQKSQLPEAQRLESNAIAGLYGDKAETAARMAMTAQSRERKAFIAQLGDIDRVGDAGDVLDNVFETIKSQSKSLKGQVDNAYDLARQGGGTKIAVEDIKDGLFANVARIKKEAQYDIKSMPQATARVKEMARLVRKSEGGKFTYANLSAMENWRKRVTNSINSSQDKTEKRFLRQIIDEYDGFMYKTANEAASQDDSAAIMAFREAVTKRREYGRLYESDKFVEDLIGGKKSLDDAVKDLIGTGSIVGKKRMEGTYDAIIKAARDQSNAVRSDLQTAFAKKLLTQSIEGLEAGGEQAYLSAAKTKSALEGLFVNNRSFATKLYSKQVVDTARQAIKELEYIAKTQSATQNPSGSGQLVLRALQKTPMLNLIGKAVDASSNEFKAAAANKSFGEIISELQIKPQSSFFAPITGGQIAASMGE